MADAPHPIDVQKALEGADYPARGDGLVALAERNGAPAEVVEALRGLAGRDLDGPDAVTAAVFR